MKAAVFEGLGRPLVIRDLQRPVPRPGQILLRVDFCGICGSDLHATEPGVFVVPEGTVLGHEFAGEVVESADPAFAPGDRVTALPVNACANPACQALGRCKDGLGILCPQNRITGLALDVPGAYAELVAVGARQAVKLPDSVPTKLGALVEPLAVGLHAVRISRVGLGARVLVIGAGPIGLSVAVFACAAGARAVVVSERNHTRRALAARMGATATLDAPEDLAGAFAAAAGGPPEVIFDCVGAPGLIQACIDASRPRGQIVVVGVLMNPDTIVPIRAILKEIDLQFVLGYVEEDFALVLDALAAGRIDAAAMITGEVTLDALPEAFEALRTPSTQVKVLVRPGG
jgi:(R,R)-butanediol dehydrogenase/meso-butanediol dehydrogenase/diacetyl reductase